MLSLPHPISAIVTNPAWAISVSRIRWRLFEGPQGASHPLIQGTHYVAWKAPSRRSWGLDHQFWNRLTICDFGKSYLNSFCKSYPWAQSSDHQQRFIELRWQTNVLKDWCCIFAFLLLGLERIVALREKLLWFLPDRRAVERDPRHFGSRLGRHQ